MARKSSIAVNFEYAALRFFCALVNLMPYRVAMAVASVIGVFAVDVIGINRKRTMGRLKSVFPDKSTFELRSIARRSFINILKTGVEMIRAPRLSQSWMDKHVLDGRFYKDRLQDYVDEGKGVVIMVPHTGNWYMAAWSMAKYGLKLSALAARQRNLKIDAWMKRQYGQINVIDRSNKDALSRIKSCLATGGAFAILPDLRVNKRDVEVDFLGGKANVSHSGAMFAVYASAPIVVAAMRREKGKHVFTHLATLRPDPEAKDKRAEAHRLTKLAMGYLDGFVRRHPGEWFWYNKRWILQPPSK